MVPQTTMHAGRYSEGRPIQLRNMFLCRVSEWSELDGWGRTYEGTCMMM